MTVCGGVRGGVCHYLGGSDRHTTPHTRITAPRIPFLALAVAAFFAGLAFDSLLPCDRLGVVGRGRSHALSGGQQTVTVAMVMFCCWVDTVLRVDGVGYETLLYEATAVINRSWG